MSEDTIQEPTPEEQAAIDLEAEVLKREHRLGAAAWSYFRPRKTWPRGDKRRAAARTALFFATITALKTTAVVGGGGLLAYLTYYEMTRQTNKVDEQNDLLEQQNAALLSVFDAENKQRLLQRKTDLISLLWAKGEDGSLVHAQTLRQSAVDELLSVWDDLGESPDFRGAQLAGLDLSGRSLRGARFQGADLRDVNLIKADLQAALFEGADLQGANLGSADLRSACFCGNDLGGVSLAYSDVRLACFVGCVIPSFGSLVDVHAYLTFVDSFSVGSRARLFEVEGFYVSDAATLERQLEDYGHKVHCLDGPFLVRTLRLDGADYHIVQAIPGDVPELK